MGFLDEHCLFHELTDEKITASKPFYCGNNDLDDFFHEDVTKFSYNLMGKSYCFVLEDDPSIIVCASSIPKPTTYCPLAFMTTIVDGHPCIMGFDSG